MKMHPVIVIAIAAGLCAGAAAADDHLFQAMQHGLGEKSADQHPFVANKSDHSGDEANGQGSPFTGHDMKVDGLSKAKLRPSASPTRRSRAH